MGESRYFDMSGGCFTSICRSSSAARGVSTSDIGLGAGIGQAIADAGAVDLDGDVAPVDAAAPQHVAEFPIADQLVALLAGDDRKAGGGFRHRGLMLVGTQLHHPFAVDGAAIGVETRRAVMGAKLVALMHDGGDGDQIGQRLRRQGQRRGSRPGIPRR